MTKQQRLVERDFWLGVAETVDQLKYDHGLCYCVDNAGGGRWAARLDALDLFDPLVFGGYWWDTPSIAGHRGQGPREGRVLAACFIAAMAEAGDLDDLTS